MISKAAFLLLLLCVLKLVWPRLGTPTTIQNPHNNHRLLGRWSFDEPCIAGPILYEDPNEGFSFYDINLQRYTRINGRLYEDESLTTASTAYTDAICNIIALPDHIICNYYIVDDTFGVFSLFSGIAKLEFPGSVEGSKSSKNKKVQLVGTGRYVYQGGNITYEKDIST